MSSEVSAIVIAAVGVLGTLAAAIVSPLLAARARREDFNLQLQREEEYVHQRQETDRASKRPCYVDTMASTRHYRMDLINYLELVRRGETTSISRSDLNNSRRACLASLAEVGLVAPQRVLAAIDPINTCLSKAYRDTKLLEAGKRKPEQSLAEVNQSLQDLCAQLQAMGNAMRRYLSVAD
jgi:hypothetical protein